MTALTEGVAQLVVQRHADHAQAGSAGPRAEERVAAGLPVLRVLIQDRQRGGDTRDALFRKHVCDGVGFFRVQCFNGVGDRVDSRSYSHLRGQSEGEVNIVNDDLWQHLGCLLGCLQAVLRLADDSCCL